MSGIPIISVVAFSGTGKTTFLERLIPELKRRGLRLAVMKHDAHDFQVDREGQDSWRMTQAGADVTVLTNGRRAVLFENRPVADAQLLDQIRDVDLILTEGYKHGPWKKIALYRPDVGKPFPCDMEECMAVVSDAALETGSIPRYDFDAIEAIADLIEEEIRQ